jgi:hypothetical protein
MTAVNKAWQRERLVEGVSLLNSRFFFRDIGFMRETPVVGTQRHLGIFVVFLSPSKYLAFFVRPLGRPLQLLGFFIK